MLKSIIALGALTSAAMLLQRDSTVKGSDVESVVNAFNRRAKTTPTVLLEWDEQQTIVAGTMPASSKSSQKGPQPPTDQVNQMKCSLVIGSAGNMRFEREGPTWVVRHCAFLPRRYVSTFNNAVAKNYHSGNFDPKIYSPVGFIRKELTAWDQANPDIAGPLAHFRGGANDYRGYHVSNESVLVDGQQCLMLQRQSTLDDGSSPIYFVDQSPERQIRRLVFRYAGKPTVTIDIALKEDKSGVSHITGWNGIVTDPNSGRLRRQFTARVTQRDYQPQIDAATFDFQYPAGTEVIDYRTDSSFIVTNDGGRRIVTNQERMRGASYVDILNSESGMARPARAEAGWTPTRLSFISGNAMIFMASIFYYARRRYLARTRTL